MHSEIGKIYGDRVRVRACGLCWRDSNSLLLINHKRLTKGDFWAPPGGGVEFGQTCPEALKREFEEETGLIVKVGKFLFVSEFIRPPLHAVELFFDVTIEGGELRKGFDPEMTAQHQIIEDIRFVPFENILRMPREERHGILSHFDSAGALKNARGYFTS